MPFQNMPGAFGSDINRERNNRHQPSGKQRRTRFRLPFDIDLRRISPERWVDIVCGTIIGIFLISVLFTWSDFSDALFEKLLFPVVYVGSKIVTYTTVAAACIGSVFGKFRRRRFWL